MIGRTDPVNVFDVIRWARAQTVAHDLKPIEAHILLLLASYANDEAVAWPGIATLADAAGVARRGHRSATVSRALARLETLGVVWSEQGGNGRPARRHLLFNPARETVGPIRPQRSHQRDLSGLTSETLSTREEPDRRTRSSVRASANAAAPMTARTA